MEAAHADRQRKRDGTRAGADIEHAVADLLRGDYKRPKENVGAAAKSIGGFLVTVASQMTATTAAFLLNLFVMVYAMFFFFRDGEKILERMLEELSFEAPDMKMGRVKINAAYVKERLDKIAEEVCRKRGALPSFKGYNGFPASEVTSQGAPRNGTEQLKSSLVGTGFPFKELSRLDAYLAALRSMMTSSAGVRRAGAITRACGSRPR